jgi:hypothetical protein
MKRFLLIASIITLIIPLAIIAMDKNPLSADLKIRYYIAVKNLTEHNIYLTVDNDNPQEPILQILPDKLLIVSIPLKDRSMVKVILPTEYYSNETYLPMYGLREEDYFIIKKNAINPQCIDIQQATKEQLKEAYQ